MEYKELKNGWRLFSTENKGKLEQKELEELEEKYRCQKTGYEIPSMPMQVLDVLTYHGVVEDPAKTGSGEESRWVSQNDWLYVIRLDAEDCAAKRPTWLYFGGVDTFADFYWNREWIDSSEDVFLPVLLKPRNTEKKENWLVVHVHSPWKKMEEMQVPQRYQNKVMPKWALFRGFHRGYDDYLGFPPYLTRMGLYDEVWMASGENGLKQTEVSVSVLDDGKRGKVAVAVDLFGEAEVGAALRYELWDENERLCSGEGELEGQKGRIRFMIDNPILWETAQRGNPYLYSLKIYLTNHSEIMDCRQKKIGFRVLKKTGDMEFELNGKPIKLWGANLAPIDNKTGCYDAKRAEALIKKALHANMNCIRVWGGGDRLPDVFYDMCDQLGVLLWQDFFHDYSMYPEEYAFRELCRKEARYQIRRLKHHPSILLWCGSNESVMCRDFSNPGEECIGYEIYDEDYRGICQELDPERYYHMSSPCGGKYANDPLEGDTHSYTSTWFVPGGRYPVFLSENMRSFLPPSHSMKRMIGEKGLWPEDYSGQMTKGNLFPWPPSWKAFTSADGWRKISEVEQFYDADDLPSMIYRFGASVSKYMTECIGRYRRGRSYEERYENYRKCKGHLWWKLNTSAPHIYSGLMDYYLEPCMPYFALKRLYQPFQIFFSKDDYIGVWLVNDTLEVQEGTVYIKLFHLNKNAATKFMKKTFRIRPDESLFLTDLNAFGQFLMNEHILYAKVTDTSGKVMTEMTDYVDIERHMEFPDAKLTITDEGGGEFRIETDRFARCVELWGEDGGDRFGWDFSDNYFDLMPGQSKKIRISGKHSGGIIHAKGYYSSEESILNWGNVNREVHYESGKQEE